MFGEVASEHLAPIRFKVDGHTLFASVKRCEKRAYAWLAG
jgi:hypothetical protein